MDSQIKYYRILDSAAQSAIRTWAVTFGNNAQYIEGPDGIVVSVWNAVGSPETTPRFESEFAGLVEEIDL